MSPTITTEENAGEQVGLDPMLVDLSGATPDKETVVTTVVACARCGKTHVQMLFAKLARQQKEWTHWALCPTTGEPVMLSSVPTEFAQDVFGMSMALCDADRVMKAIDDAILHGRLDARSKIGDLRLNYGQPHTYQWLDQLEKRRNNLTLPAEPAAAS